MGRQRPRRDADRRSRSVQPNDGDAAPPQVCTCPICAKQKSLLSFDEELGCCIKCKYNRKCSACKNVKPIEQFDKALGICAKCKAKRFPEARDDNKPKPAGPSGRTRTRACPVCLQKVAVTSAAGDWTITPHKKSTRTGQSACGGSGKVLFHERHDALDHTVPGSFEGGRRR